VYVSAPANLSGDPQAQDVVDAEKLAFSQLSGQVKGYTLKLQVLTGTKISDNARSAIEDKSSAAYLGEISQGQSADSIGITNAEDLLQVSPTDTAPAPKNLFESFGTYGRTFASVTPTSGQETQAIVSGSAGKAFARAFRSTYVHPPSAHAILGYAAMAAVLKALQKAGSAANDRGTIRSAFFTLKNAQLVIGQGGPVLGTYTVNSGGTLTITPGSGSTAP
jgi:ABC-type branched-subunit amino acid transport system substrate-binding protein